jgi:predicted PurR-regulated permease PerM
MDILAEGASIVMVLALVAVVLGVVLVVCWIVLPFAVVGLKPLVRELIREQQATNKLIEAQVRALDALEARYEPMRSLPSLPPA